MLSVNVANLSVGFWREKREKNSRFAESRKKDLVPKVIDKSATNTVLLHVQRS